MNHDDNHIQCKHRQNQKPFTFHHDRITSTSDLYFPLYVSEVTAVNVTNTKIVDCSSGKCSCLENITRKKTVCFDDTGRNFRLGKH